MKKPTLVAVAAAATFSAGFTHAQAQGGDAQSGQGTTAPAAREPSAGSYARLSGSVDTVIRRDSGGAGPVWSVGPGGARSSRLTFSIKEEISRDLAGTAVLEAAYNPDTGAAAGANGGLIFARTAHVGVGADSWGYITMGRQFTPMQAVTAGPINDPFGGAWLGGIATIYNKNSGASNTVAYTYGYSAEALLRPAPRNGLGVAVLYAFGEEPTPLENAGKQYGFNVSYGGSNWWGAYAYHRQVGNSGAINPAAAVSESPKITHQYVGGAYEFGRFRVSLGLNSGKNDTGTLDRRNVHIGLLAGVGERGTVRFIHGRANDRTATNGDFKTTQIAYLYDLSKRTGLYVVWGNVDNSAATAVSLSGALGGAVSRGAMAKSLAFGVRHNF